MFNPKRYLVELNGSILLYLIVLFFSINYLNNYPDDELKIWVSILPVVPAALATIAVVRGILSLDELQQRIQLVSFTISFALIGLSTFTYGFLENVGFPHIPYIFIFPAMIFTWGFTLMFVVRFYR